MSSLRRARIAIGLFIAGLVLSGLTAFPLLAELNLLVRWISPGGAFESLAPAGLQHWILLVRDGLADTYVKYPWIAYGTDWLAFGHIVIALFFIPVWRDPVSHVGTLKTGIVACVLVLPLALIAGPLRGIPFYWRLIDCSFGVFGSCRCCMRSGASATAGKLQVKPPWANCAVSSCKTQEAPR